MQYMLMICGNEEQMPSPGPLSTLQGCSGWAQEMSRRGVLRGGAGLRPSTDATTVRVRQDGVLLTDGPFAETKDQIAGYNVIECADLDEAIEIASKHPAARFGSIEVRPLWDA
ncbi:YciI family protein [Micromonospora mangrovi]|uniref:YciI family protein n=2 Tax=Micromonospora TaxID=1873 RepID=A0AAU7M7H4_9ACTN